MGTIGDIRTRFAVAINEAKQPGKGKIEEFWLEGFKTFMKSNDFAKASSRKGNTGEVLRGNFGSNDGTAESKIIEFLDKVGGLKQNSYDIEYLQVGVISSDYGAYKIIIKKGVEDRLGKKYKKNDFFVITNRFKISKKTGEASIIGKKDLTPDKLKITKAVYESPEHLLSIVSTKIKALNLPENYVNFILKSTEEIMKSGDNVGIFDNLEAYTSSASTNIDFKISEELFDGIDQLSINNFQNDYGEILGGFLLFKILKQFKNGVSYPQNSNEKLVDFYFDGYSISSKAGKKGGTPSGQTMIDKIHELHTNNIINPVGTKENDFFNNVVDQWINPPKLSRSNTYNNIMNLCSVNISDRDNSAYWHISKETGLGPGQMNQDVLVTYLDNLYEEDPIKFKEFIKETWVKSGIGSKVFKNLDTYVDGYMGMGKNKIGIIFYCLQVEIKDVLNKMYGEQLTKFSQMATDVKQIYLQVDVKRGKFSFKAVPFKSANFEFEQKGSIPNPFNANLGIAASSK